MGHMELERYRDTRENAKPERGTLCKVEVDCLTSNQVVPGASLVPFGVSVVELFEKDLASVRKHMVMDEVDLKRYAQAEETFATKRKADLENHLNGLTGDANRAIEEAKFLQSYNGSVPSTHRALFSCDPKPFKSLRIVQEGIPAPVDEARLERDTETATLVAKVTAQVVAQMQGAKQKG